MLKKNGILLIIAAMLFIAALSVTALVGGKLNQANAWVMHTYKVIAGLDQVYANVQKAESDARGYVLIGNVPNHDPFRVDRLHAEHRITDLQQLAGDNAQQIALLELWRQQVEAKLSFCEETLQVDDKSPAEAAVLVRSSAGAALMQSVLNTHDQLMERENTFLAERQSQLRQMNLLAIPVVIVLLASGLALLVVAMSITHCALIREGERADELERSNSELQESKRLFDNFMQYTPALTWIKDDAGCMLWCNQNFYQTFNLGPHQVIGRTTLDFLPQIPEISQEAEKHVREGGVLVKLVAALPVGTGESRYFFISKFPIETRHGRLIGGIALDVNDQHLAEAQVSELNEQLRNHVKQLEVTRDRALEASALKSAFVANISHEIRTPLSGIIGMNELLLGSGLSDEQRALAETVHESSLSLLTVLNDILDLSKIEAGKMSFAVTPFNLKWLVEDSLRLMSAAATSKGLKLQVTFVTSIPKFIIGDAERVRQVLLNLIGNAVKFTEHGGVSVAVAITSENEETDEISVRFTVSDTGIGISDEDRRFLFVPFAQVDNSSTRRFGGTGLGLTICQKLVGTMGGHIDVSSEPNVGSTFWFVLPFRRHAAEPSVKPLATSPRPHNSEHRCVLVVEDNAVLQHLAVMQLTALGVSSRVAQTGLEALEVFQQMHFDLVLMDVHLPKMNGFEVTEKIRELEKGADRHTPIVAMTAGAMEGDRQRCLAAGMDDYLSKPVAIDSLRRVIDHWIGEHPHQTKSA